MRTRSVPAVILAVLAAACGGGGDEAASRQPATYAWRLPAGFPVPPVPEGNPMSEAKVALGRRLFHDRRLSLNETQACATCHQQARAFTDGKGKAVGSTGEVHKRGALSITNAAYRATYNWENSLLRTLEQQALVPLFNMDPAVELGMDGHEDVLLARLAADPEYPALFRAAFPERPAPDLDGTVKAIAAFVRTIVSGDSPYDRFRLGDAAALSAAAQRGLALFRGKARCAGCHGGLTFTDAEWTPGLDLRVSDVPFHNEGLYDVDGAGGYPFADQGLAVQTGRAEDVGLFRAPTLRNVAVTAPYMHDGSLATLAEVVDHYADPFSLDGAGKRVAPSPRRDPLVRDIVLTAGERADLVAFLEALTDEGLLTDPRYADPFAAATTAAAGAAP